MAKVTFVNRLRYLFTKPTYSFVQMTMIGVFLAAAIKDWKAGLSVLGMFAILALGALLLSFIPGAIPKDDEK